MRHVGFALALSVLCASGSAVAQQTTCVRNGMVTTCRPTGGIDWSIMNRPAPESPMDAFYRGQAAAAERQRQEAAALAAQQEYARQQQARASSEETESRGREAGALIAQGRCGEAEKLALNAGDFPLVSNVRMACQK